MSKKKKVVIGIICIIVILFVIDLISIYTIGRPLIAIKKGNEKMYAGILYDVFSLGKIGENHIAVFIRYSGSYQFIGVSIVDFHCCSGKHRLRVFSSLKLMEILPLLLETKV